MGTFKNLEIEYNDVYLNVEGTYSPECKGDDLTPDTANEVSLLDIKLDDVSIMEHYEQSEIEEIEEIIYNELF